MCGEEDSGWRVTFYLSSLFCRREIERLRRR